MSTAAPSRVDPAGVSAFLIEHPEMRLRPSADGCVLLEGRFSFHADFEGGPVIEDAYMLRIEVPKTFPNAVPAVFELGGRIPRDVDYHVFPRSGQLCLGSTLRLHEMSRQEERLAPFARKTIVPFLYASSFREATGGPYPFGELAHGHLGLLDDYGRMLNLSEPEQVHQALALAARPKRIANKRLCPCGCGRRLGVCRFNQTVKALRSRFGRHVLEAAWREAVGGTEGRIRSVPVSFGRGQL